MKLKISILSLLCVAVLLPSIVTAQEFDIFAKQKVVVADINDMNERKLNDGIKQVIRQGIIDACINSNDYEIFEVNIDDIKRGVTANGQVANFANICKAIGTKADYIIFTNIKLSSSELGSQNITIYITSSLYRIATGSEIKTQVAEALPNSQSIISSTSRLVTGLLCIEQKADKPMADRTVAEMPANEVSKQYSSVDSPKAIYEKGRELRKEERYSEAAQYYRQAAEQGYAPAQNSLGVLYVKGLGVTKDYYEAVKWYRKSAQQGYIAAQYNLGYSYERGRGITQDYSEAVQWYRKAAEKGDRKAQSRLAECCYYGRGVAEDHYEAVKWARKAAESGDAQAQFRLGYCYNNGKGVAQDRYEGARWYRKAAEKGHTGAQFNLGLCYEHGRGVEQDISEAKRWYQKAADKGHSKAEEKLNNM